MSRFKEANRIEAAIKHNNQQELEWARSYAQMRLETASMKGHVKHWQKVLKKVSSVLNEVEE